MRFACGHEPHGIRTEDFQLRVGARASSGRFQANRVRTPVRSNLALASKQHNSGPHGESIVYYTLTICIHSGYDIEAWTT